MEGLTKFEPGFDFLAKTFAGLEDVLATELKQLGAKNVEIVKRGATFKGDTELMYKTNYLSRTALRILKPIGVFEAKSNDQLYEKVKKIDWTKIFKVNQTFIVNANVFYSEVGEVTGTPHLVVRSDDETIVEAQLDELKESYQKTLRW